MQDRGSRGRIDFGDPALPVAGLGSLAHVKRSFRGRYRAWTLGLVHLAIAAHLTHWLVSGRTLSPAEPSESMYTLELGQINAGFVFLAVALLATLIFGRFVCGWGCHLVALQDLCGWLLRRLGIRPQPFRSRLLAWTPAIVAAYMFAWPTISRLVFEPAPRAFPGFSNHLVTDTFWKTFPGPWMAGLTFAVCGFAAVWFLGSKGFCTYACPYGALFAFVDRLSPAAIRVSDACEQCGHCTATCTSNVRVHEEVRRYGRVVDPGCMKCLDCVSVCPTGALSFGFGKPAFLTWARAPRRDAAPPIAWGEELLVAGVALVAALTFRGLYKGPYGGPGLLLAVTLGGLTAFLALRCWQLLGRRGVRLQHLALKVDGRWRWAGVGFAIVAGLWFMFTAHSALVQWNRWSGGRWLERTEASRAEVFDGSYRTRHYSPAHELALERAERRLARAERWGLLPMLDVETGLAWTALLRDDPVRGLEHLATATQLAPDNAGLRRDRIGLLATSGRLDEALAEAGELARTGAAGPEDHFVRAGFLVAAGRAEEAIEAYRDCLAAAPGALEARYNLGGLLRRAGRTGAAVTELAAVVEASPVDRDAHVELGLALRDAGDTAGAIAHLQHAIDLAPEHPESRFHLPGLIREIESVNP